MSPKHYDMQLIKEVHYQITHNVLAPVNLTILIAETNISVATFIKYYKELYSKTPARHHFEITMLYAKQRIKEGEQIKSVARELGYHDVSNFSRKFKQVIGYAPSKVQRD